MRLWLGWHRLAIDGETEAHVGSHQQACPVLSHDDHMGIQGSRPGFQLSLLGDHGLPTSPMRSQRFGPLFWWGGEEREPGWDFH